MKSSEPTPTLFDQPRPGNNMPEYGVSELSKLLKKTVEETFGLVRVRGEISGLKIAPSGHVYFNLKDDEAVLASVCWKGQFSKLGIRPEEGMEVICTGRLTTYPARSNYQLTVEGMTLAGMGALLKLLDDRKKKLAAEGLFDPSRKQELPFLPDVIGVVTSPTGAVIQDILHRLEDRFPRRVLVWPVLVQGPGAAEQIAAAIRGFNNLPEIGPVPRPGLIIVARGGGSIEDLMAFNEEIVVRAAADSDIALISAVGHETDTTLIDFASDRRAPTPTAAAEMAVPVRANLVAQVRDDSDRLFQAMQRLVSDRRDRLVLIKRALGDPQRVLEPLAQKLDERVERLGLAWKGFLERRQARVTEIAMRISHPREVLNMSRQQFSEKAMRLLKAWSVFHDRKEDRIRSIRLRDPTDILKHGLQRLTQLDQMRKAAIRQRVLGWEKQLENLQAELKHLSPKAVLGRGYALIQDDNGHVITTRAGLTKGQSVKIELNDGSVGATIKD